MRRAELEKLGQKYRIALRIARDERWERLKCDHKGVYADDCLVERVQKHKSELSYSLVHSSRILKHQLREACLGGIFTFVSSLQR